LTVEAVQQVTEARLITSPSLTIMDTPDRR
jgi:hypothetical protein